MNDRPDAPEQRGASAEAGAQPFRHARTLLIAAAIIGLAVVLALTLLPAR